MTITVLVHQTKRKKKMFWRHDTKDNSQIYLKNEPVGLKQRKMIQKEKKKTFNYKRQKKCV